MKKLLVVSVACFLMVGMISANVVSKKINTEPPIIIVKAIPNHNTQPPVIIVHD